MSNFEATEKSGLGSRQTGGLASEALREVHAERMKSFGTGLEHKGTKDLPAHLDIGSPYNKGQENHVQAKKDGESHEAKTTKELTHEKGVPVNKSALPTYLNFQKS